MTTAIRIDQPENMLRLTEDCDDIRTLNNHCWMGPCRHSCGAWRQALRIRILGMIDILISLSSIWCQDELLSRQRVLCNVIRSEEHTSELQSLRHLVCRLLLEK